MAYMSLSFILAVIGVFMVVNPRGFYEITEKWKSTADSEPSDLFLLSTRFGGIMFLAVGIMGVVVFWMA